MYKISYCFQVHSFAMVSGVRGEAGAPWKVSEHGEAMSTTAAAMVTVMMRLLLEKMDVGQVYCGMRKLIVLSLIQVGY